MKIVQQINFQAAMATSDAASANQRDARLYFDPALFSGIAAVYFEATTRYVNGSANGTLKLIDLDTLEELASFTANQANWTRQRSADLSASFASARNLGITLVKNSGSGSNVPACTGCSIIVEHEDTGKNRKTATYIPLHLYLSKLGTTPWNYNAQYYAYPPIDQFDGTVKATLEVFVKTTAGGVADVHLYDVTAGAEVAGSLMSTDQVVYTRLESGSLTLVAGHKYRVETRNQTAGQYSYIISPFVKITASGFTKIAAAALSFTLDWFATVSGFCRTCNIGYFDPAKITAADSLAFRFDWSTSKISAGAAAFSIRAYDLTASAVIAGTEHTGNYTGVSQFFYQDTPTVPAAIAEIALQKNFTGGFYLGTGQFYAFMQEAIVTPPSLPADPAQPSGYHCFMSQFLKNLLAGYIPLQTPDGVNKLW